jgi:ornithine cyclodeaminase/alanine dehydrogenase-like protein (mu-crystallin family)
MPRWLNEDDVRAVLSPVELIDAIETALSDFSAGRVAQPVRTAIGSLRLCDLARYKEPFADRERHCQGDRRGRLS